MSKRITFNDFELEQLIKIIEEARDRTTIDYEVLKVGKRFCNTLIKKLLPNGKENIADEE